MVVVVDEMVVAVVVEAVDAGANEVVDVVDAVAAETTDDVSCVTA